MIVVCVGCSLVTEAGAERLAVWRVPVEVGCYPPWIPALGSAKSQHEMEVGSISGEEVAAHRDRSG